MSVRRSRERMTPAPLEPTRTGHMAREPAEHPADTSNCNARPPLPSSASSLLQDTSRSVALSVAQVRVEFGNKSFAIKFSSKHQVELVPLGCIIRIGHYVYPFETVEVTHV